MQSHLEFSGSTFCVLISGSPFTTAFHHCIVSACGADKGHLQPMPAYALPKNYQTRRPIAWPACCMRAWQACGRHGVGRPQAPP